MYNSNNLLIYIYVVYTLIRLSISTWDFRFGLYLIDISQREAEGGREGACCGGIHVCMMMEECYLLLSH